MRAICVVLLSVVLTFSNCDDFVPSYITPCEFTDPKIVDCVQQQIQVSLPEFTKGIKELDVPSIDPVQLDDILIDGNGLKLKFTESAMHGLSKAKLTKLKVNLGKAEEPFTLAFKCDLSLTAKYDVDGKILILPIKGNGDALVEAMGIEVTIESKLNHVKDSKGAEHFKLAPPSYKYTIQKTTFDLKNLFNGNKQLAETTLQFANENWQQLMDDLAPPAIKQIVKTIVKNINKFFAKVKISSIVKGYTES